MRIKISGRGGRGIGQAGKEADAQARHNKTKQLVIRLNIT